jgi:signal transduction histidine kinase
VGAATAWIVTPGWDGRLVVAAAEGGGADVLVGATLDPVDSHSARAMTGGQPVTVADLTGDGMVVAQARLLDLGPGVYLPLMAEGGAVGALVVARRHTESAFDPMDLSVAQVFASAAGVVLALGEARSELEAVQMTAEHERIARDLHDTVIQHLFAVGMGLQAVRRSAEGTVAERIDQAVDALDTVIRDIRETIFDLNRPEAEDLDLRQRVRQVVADATHQLGFPPHVGFHGPVGTVIDDRVAGHLLAELREALSNAGRHAKASRVEVALSVDATFAVLRVTDDGVGLPESLQVGHGLANMAQRADQLGGSMEVRRPDGHGAEIVWRVPLAPSGEE